MDDTLRKLREELHEQVIMQSRLMNVENDFFESAKKMEGQRHEDAMKSLEESQTARICQIKSHEAHYLRQLSQVRSQSAAKRRALARTLQRDLNRLRPAEGGAPADDVVLEDEIVDEKYAEIVASEIQRLRSENRSITHPGKAQNRRLRSLAEELEAYIQLT
jgi:hypothetical protein